LRKTHGEVGKGGKETGKGGARIRSNKNGEKGRLAPGAGPAQRKEVRKGTVRKEKGGHHYEERRPQIRHRPGVQVFAQKGPRGKKERLGGEGKGGKRSQ